MNIEDKLDSAEMLFHKTVFVDYPVMVDMAYEDYIRLYNKNIDYIWYKELDTGIDYVRDIYEQYKQGRKTDY